MDKHENTQTEQAIKQLSLGNTEVISAGTHTIGSGNVYTATSSLFMDTTSVGQNITRNFNESK